MLPAAWRKMWVSSATGTARAATSSANGLPAPTGASWSASPTSTTCVRAADRAQQRDEQLEVGHRRLVDDQQVARRARRRVGPWPGIQPSAEWTVEASQPGRLGHPPRGAAGRRDEQRPTRFCASAAAQISRIVAVLPVPGPPVTIDSREANAAAPPPHCSGAGTRSPGRLAGRLAARARGRRQRAHLLAPARPRARRSAGGRPRRVARRRPRARARRRRPSRAAARVGRRRRRAARRAVAGSSRDRQARRAVALGLGEHVHDGRAGARGRVRRARRRRARSCRRSRKPTPNTLVSSYGRSRTTRCARSPYCLAIRGTSQASPCGASSRCSARRRAQPVPGARPPRWSGAG